METIITIKKNKPAFKALILLAKELEKNDHTAISVSERVKPKERNFGLIPPVKNAQEQSSFFDQFNINLEGYTFDRDELYDR